MKSLTVALLDYSLFKFLNFDSYKLLETFAERYSFKINYVKWNKSESDLGGIDVLAVDFEPLMQSLLNIEIPLVLEHQEISIIVPVSAKSPKYNYFVEVFSTTLILIYIFLIIVFGIVSAFITNLKSRKIDISREILVGFSLSSNQSTNVYYKKSFLHRWIYFLMFIFGIIFTNLYTVYLGTFFVKGMDERLSTIWADQRGSEFLKPRLPKLAFQVLDFKDYLDCLFNLDMRRSYYITSYVWMRFFYFQKYYGKSIFRVKSPWFGGYKFHSASVFNSNFEHLNEIKEFLVLAYSSGLMNKWSHEMSIQNIMQKMRSLVPQREPIVMDDLKIIFKFIGIGWLITGIIFLFEILYDKLKQNNKI